MTSTKTMRAWAHTRSGLPSSVLSLANLPIPTISSPSQVLVRISHCALNPGGSIVMQLLPFIFRASPAIPEMDFSGTIVECGANIPEERNLKIGSEVFGSIPLSQHVKSIGGALAEYVVVDASSVVRKPSEAKLEEVAGLGIAGATALEVVKGARLKKGDSVLVNGASGGIGHIAVQLCRDWAGETGRVVGVCSGGNGGWVKTLGCDEVIDYQSSAPVHSFLASKFSGERFNAVIDAAGVQDIFNHCPEFLAEGKPYVTVGPRAESFTVSGMLATIWLMAKNFLWPRILGGVPREYVQVTGVSNLEAMEELAKMVGEGKLRVVVDSCTDMKNAREAYEKMLSRHAKGKVIVMVHNAAPK
ncbi:GroES-like protein [Zopfia rhizophila CBS 207.26]|uniref:GroES-like protein n=1 Tax=Zopfia rhizophila CBS 207.26 TaxID=1314779 RepID=A0A6A6DPL6_9PEZI|nr:GroES-like protein [Zopfia rhizophila CBS 207.26]